MLGETSPMLAATCAKASRPALLVVPAFDHQAVFWITGSARSTRGSTRWPILAMVLAAVPAGLDRQLRGIDRVEL